MSILVLLLTAIAGWWMSIKRIGNPELLTSVLLAGLGLSDILAIASTLHHRHGWRFFVLPGAASVFWAAIYLIGEP